MPYRTPTTREFEVWKIGQVKRTAAGNTFLLAERYPKLEKVGDLWADSGNVAFVGRSRSDTR